MRVNKTFLWRDGCLADLVAVSVTDMSTSPCLSPICWPPASSDDKMHFVLGIFYKAAKSISSILVVRSDTKYHYKPAGELRLAHTVSSSLSAPSPWLCPSWSPPECWEWPTCPSLPSLTGSRETVEGRKSVCLCTSNYCQSTVNINSYPIALL